jgi:bifunctional non-homologous end joining protein LigD
VNVRFIKPMECLSAKKLPTGDGWTYEIKLDGFRVQAVRTEERVTLYSKQAKSLTSQFFRIALELENLPPDTVLDGRTGRIGQDWCPEIQLASELPLRVGAPDVLCL